MANPRFGHWHIAKKMLQYLKRTMTLKIKYAHDIKKHKVSYGGLGFVSYADSNYVSDTKTRQSTMGYIYCLNRMAVS